MPDHRKPSRLDHATGAVAVSERWCRTSLAARRSDGSGKRTVASGRGDHHHGHCLAFLIRSMKTNIHTGGFQGPVVGPSLKRPDAAEDRPRCRAPSTLRLPGRQGHRSTMSCSVSSSGPQPRGSSEHIIIDEHVVRDSHAAGTPGETHSGRKRSLRNGLASIASAASVAANLRRNMAEAVQPEPRPLMMVVIIDWRLAITSRAYVDSLGPSLWRSSMGRARRCCRPSRPTGQG
jgi:hypothetical protein